MHTHYYISAVGNMCFFGHCDQYCDTGHAVCGRPDMIEGSAAMFLPSDDRDIGFYVRKTFANPWAGAYTRHGILPMYQRRDDYCEMIQKTAPYNSGRRLLDMVDMAILDFLGGQLSFADGVKKH